MTGSGKVDDCHRTDKGGKALLSSSGSPPSPVVVVAGHG